MNLGGMAVGLANVYPGQVRGIADEQQLQENALRLLREQQMLPLQLQAARAHLGQIGRTQREEDLAGNLILQSLRQGSPLASEMPGATVWPQPPGTPSVPSAPPQLPPGTGMPPAAGPVGLPPSMAGMGAAPLTAGSPGVPPAAAPGAGPGGSRAPGPAAPGQQDGGLDWRRVASFLAQQPNAQGGAILKALHALSPFLNMQSREEVALLRQQLAESKLTQSEKQFERREERLTAAEEGRESRFTRAEAGKTERAAERSAIQRERLDLQRQQTEARIGQMVRQGQRNEALDELKNQRAIEQTIIGAYSSGMPKAERDKLIAESKAYHDRLEQQIRGGAQSSVTSRASPGTVRPQVPTPAPAVTPSPRVRTFNAATGQLE